MNHSFENKEQTPKRQASHEELHNALAFPSRTVVHAKLEMTEPGDNDEQEADAMANAVVSGEKIRRKISGSGGSSGIAVSQQMESHLSQLQGSGRQMPDGLRSMMESGFGQDFSNVRLHTDSEAASMSSSIQAKAFTHGNDIYFNQGQFSPETTKGQRLVAHELTHVVQGTGKVGRKKKGPTTDFESIQKPSYLDSVSNLIQHLIDIAALQKGRTKKVDGKNQYHRDMNTSGNWCDTFVHWCFIKAFNPIGFEQRSYSDNNFTAISRGIIDFTMYENYRKHMSGSVSNSLGILLDYDGDANQTGDPALIPAKNPVFVRQDSNKEAMYNRIDQEYIGNKNYTPDQQEKYSKSYKRLYDRLQQASVGDDREPLSGDIIIFVGHIGIVKEVSNEGVITTIEGNTDGGIDVADRGNGVFEKKYYPNPIETDPNIRAKRIRAYNRIMGFSRPDYNGLLTFLGNVYDNEFYKKENQEVLTEMYHRRESDEKK